MTKSAHFGVLTVSLLVLLAQPASAGMEFPPARLDEIARQLSPKPAGFGRPITDRAAWEKLDEDVPTPTKPMRLDIALDAPVKNAMVTLTIQPEP